MDLSLGALCDACTREIHGRAGRTARWVSLVTTLLFGLYVLSVVPPLQVPRLVGGAATVTWYLVTRRITERLVAEWLRSR